ncbi:mechanosensitive channel MscK precursor [bacterium BMS3Bbin10]|nr:mechanosensitive channel MscK precursor [bacterium BMS3Bbin10]
MTRLAQAQLQKPPQAPNPSAPASGTAGTPDAAPAAPAGEAAPAPAKIEIPEFDLEQVLTGLSDTVLEYLDPLVTPWAFLQLMVIALCYGVAHLVAKLITPPLEKRLRGIESQPQLLRVLVVPLRRAKWILFALSLWLAAYFLREVTWPSRGYYVGLAAALAVAGVIIAIISRFIRNRSLATLFAYSAWTVAGLYIAGFLSVALTALDAAAFSVGDFRLSLLAVLKAVLFLTVLIWLAFLTGNFLERRIRQNEDLAPALQVLLSKFIKFALLTIALLGTVSAVGIDLTALTVFSGALGLGIGFGLQKIASNLISGIIILSDRSIKPGDVISLGETFGWINSLNSRYVSVLTRDGVEYLIPNESFVSEQVVNWSFSTRNIRLEVKFGVSYDCDPHEVRAIAVEAASRIDRVLGKPLPVCHIVGFGDSSLDLVLRFWIRDPKNGLTNIRGNVFLALWDAFKKHGIAIPYPHRQLIFPEGQALTPPETAVKNKRRKAPARSKR